MDNGTIVAMDRFQGGPSHRLKLSDAIARVVKMFRLPCDDVANGVFLDRGFRYRWVPVE